MMSTSGWLFIAVISVLHFGLSVPIGANKSLRMQHAGTEAHCPSYGVLGACAFVIFGHLRWNKEIEKLKKRSDSQSEVHFWALKVKQGDLEIKKEITFSKCPMWWLLSPFTNIATITT